MSVQYDNSVLHLPDFWFLEHDFDAECTHWTRIPGFSSYYASTNGDILSAVRPERPIILETWTNQYGHLYVGLIDDSGRKRKMSVHRLVAMTYIPNPDGYPQVLHGNDVPYDNCIWNLRWGTQKDNCQDMIDRKRGMHRQVWCYEDDLEFWTVKEAAEYYRAEKSQITNACQGNTKTVRGKHFCYLEDREWKMQDEYRWFKRSSGFKRVRSYNPQTNEDYIFDSRKEAAEFLGIPECGISSTISGRTPHSHGWMFEDAEVCYE